MSGRESHDFSRGRDVKSEPPYTPGFGTSPPALVGRDDLVASSLAALDAGPAHPAFCRAILGLRGVGKTVLLDAIGSAATERGWIVVNHQAIPEEPTARVLAGRVAAAAPRRGRSGCGWLRGLRLGLNAGVAHLDADLAPPTAETADLEGALRAVGRSARATGGVLLTLDEAHVLGPGDLAELSRAMQSVTRREGLPVAVLLAGLPSFATAVAASRATFFERLEHVSLGRLPDPEAAAALERPATERGVSIAPEALAAMVSASEGWPYALQLVGFHTWEAASGASRIEVHHAEAGVALATERLGRSFTARLETLRPGELAYVEAVVSLGPGPVPAAKVAAHLGRTPEQLAPTRRSLTETHHLLTSPTWGAVEVAVPILGTWLRSHGSPRPLSATRPLPRPTTRRAGLPLSR